MATIQQQKLSTDSSSSSRSGFSSGFPGEESGRQNSGGMSREMPSGEMPSQMPGNR